MKKIFTLRLYTLSAILIGVLLSINTFSQDNQYNITLSADGSWGTGYIKKVGSYYYDNEGEIKVGDGSSSKFRGWARWNTSSIPDNAIIDNINLSTYCTEVSPDTYHTIRINELSTDPSVTHTNGYSTYADIGDGINFLNAYYGMNDLYWYNADLWYDACNDLKIRLPSNWWAVGFQESGDDDERGIFAGNNNSSMEPKITVTYHLPIPPSVTTQSATNIAYNSAKLVGDINPNGEDTDYWFEWGITSSYGNTTPITNMGDGYTTLEKNTTISNLSPCTYYYFRVVAENQFGTSYGSGQNFTTTGVPPNATTNAATNISTSSATLNGYVTTYGITTDYYFEYGLTTNYGSNTSTSSISSNSNVNKNISGLQPGTTYHYRVRATNSCGTANGNDKTFTTTPSEIVISGHIGDGNGNNVDGVLITFSNGGGTATTDGWGDYSKTLQYGYSGTATPDLAQWSFSPDHIAYSNETSNLYNEDYTGTFYPLTYTISGYIKESDNTPINGVTVTFSNSGGSTTTNSSGYYSKTVNSGYTGTATPTKSGWTFNPSSKNYSSVSSNYSNENYTGTPPVVTYSISGYIKESDNTPVDGVTITFSNGEVSTTTNSSGYYSKTVSQGYSGTATPSKSGWTFSPPSKSYTSVTSNYSNENYTGTPPTVTYSISGYIKESDNTPVDGVTITFSNGGGSTTTNSSGQYSKTVSQGYSGTATPSKSGWTFSPPSKSYTSVTSNYSNENYTGTPPTVTYSISGYIKESNNTPVDGVTITFSNGGGSTTTNSSGYYTKTVSQGYSGTATPSKSGWTFSPPSKSYTSVTSNYSNENYIGTANTTTYTISGYIKESDNTPIGGVTVTFSNSGSTTTNSSGYYSRTVNSGYTGTATPTKSGWTFNPSSKNYSSVSSNYTNQNYIGFTASSIILPWTEDWESVTTSSFTSDVASIAGAPEWSYDMVDEGGRLRFEAGSNYYHNGSKAATLDRNPSGSVNTNFLIAELNLSNYTSSNDIVLSFYYMHHGEESNNNDRVWIRGSSSDNWVEIYNLYTNQGSSGNWNHVVDLDIDSILFTAVPQQTISSTFQIRFGQQDNYPSTSITALDGYTFDDIVVSEELNNGNNLSQNLQHYYKLDANLEDCIGTVDGTNSNTLNEPQGLINEAREFTGSTSCYIETSNYSAFNYLHNGSDFTISIWEKHNTGIDDSYMMMGNNIGGDRIGIFFSVYGDDVRYQVGRYPAPWPAASLNWENVLVPNTTQWNHLVLTYNDLLSTGQYTLYVNGQLVGTGDRDYSCVTGNSFYPMRFGINKLSGTIQPFNGHLDEIAFWDRTLESSEVTILYNNGDGLQYPFTIISLPADRNVQNITISNNQTECYNATNTITVAGSGTTVDVQSGGEATFIAGNKIIFNPGFTSHLGSYSNAYITTTGDYCSQQQNMAPAAHQVNNDDESTTFKDLEIANSNDDELDINIYPNPTTGEFVVDFSGDKTTAEITLHNYYGMKVYTTKIHELKMKNIDISGLPAGIYIAVINTNTEKITRRVVKTF